jgi:hypothetical protein
VYRDKDRDTRGLVPGNEDEFSFDEYVCLGFIVVGGGVGFFLSDMSGTVIGIFAGYAAFHVLVAAMTGVAALLNRRRH